LVARLMKPHLVGPITGLHSEGSLLTLPPNITLGWKEVTVRITLAYYSIELITVVNFVTVAQISTSFKNTVKCCKTFSPLSLMVKQIYYCKVFFAIAFNTVKNQLADRRLVRRH
jgi:hypothetical protein